jgi:hypothetical protein
MGGDLREGLRTGYDAAVSDALDAPGTVIASLFYAREILTKYGIDATWSATALRVAVIARLPKSEDRKLFDSFADHCETKGELIELAATVLNAFEKRRTPLRPPPLWEGDKDDVAEEQRPARRVK